MRHLLGKKVRVFGEDIGTVVCAERNNVLWVAFPVGTLNDDDFIDEETFYLYNHEVVSNIKDYYGLEYSYYDIEHVTLVEKYVPNTKIFRLLYPEAEVYQKKFLKIELK